MKVKILLFLSLLCFLLNCPRSFSQETDFLPINKDSDVELFDIDFFGNYFSVNDNVLKKYDKDYNFLLSYDNKKFGHISQVDASNPFVTLLFYENSNTIVFLDNKFSELLSPVNLDDLGFYNSQIVCNSQKGFWLFDYQKSSVFLIDHNLKTLQQSIPLYSLLGNNLLISMKETNNYLILFLDNSSVIILDQFANFVKKYSPPVDNNISCKSFNDKLFSLAKENLTIYDITNDREEKIILKDLPEYSDYKIINNTLLFFHKGKIYKKEL